MIPWKKIIGGVLILAIPGIYFLLAYAPEGRQVGAIELCSKFPNQVFLTPGERNNATNLTWVERHLADGNMGVGQWRRQMEDGRYFVRIYIDNRLPDTPSEMKKMYLAFEPQWADQAAVQPPHNVPDWEIRFRWEKGVPVKQRREHEDKHRQGMLVCLQQSMFDWGISSAN